MSDETSIWVISWNRWVKGELSSAFGEVLFLFSLRFTKT